MPTSSPPLLIDKKYSLLKGFSGPSLICAFTPLESPAFRQAFLTGFTTRHYGNMLLVKQRKNFLQELGIDYKNLAYTKQVHGSQIRYVQEAGSIDDTDALITDKRNLPLAIFTADCLPIFLYDPKALATGLVHAGWRSSKESIVVKTIKLMEEKFNTEPQDLYVGFGPAIRACCYEIGQEFNQFFLHDLIERDGHYYLDLVNVNKKQVLGLGVKEINIFDAKICTACKNEEFFSYRKEGNACGRIISVIMLK